MNLSRYGVVLIVVVSGVGAFGWWRATDPVRTARAKCKRHLEALTGFDLHVGDNFSMHVEGNARRGKVQVAFIRDEKLQIAQCTLEAGEVNHFSVDGDTVQHR